MRILITGITGYIGSNAATHFEAAGYDVYGISKEKHGGKKSKLFRTDITDATAVRKAMRAAKPAIVFHAAGISSLKECEENEKLAHAVNAIGTKNIVDSLLAINPSARLVLLSTDYVFDGRRGHYSEYDRQMPETVYGKSKLLAEKEAMRLKNSIIVRTSGVFGRGGGSFFKFLSDSFARGKSVDVYDDAFFTPTSIDFLLDSISKLIGEGFTGTIHIAGREKASRRQFALKLASAMGRPASLAKPARKPFTARIAHDSSLNCALLHRAIGSQGPNLRQSIDYAIGNLVYPYFTFTDRRGGIHGITQGRKWEEINFITSASGSVRGGHHHRKTIEGIFVVHGRIRVNLKGAGTGAGFQRSFIAEGGDFFIIHPGMSHTFEMLQDSAWVNMLSKQMGGAKKDIWKD